MNINNIRKRSATRQWGWAGVVLMSLFVMACGSGGGGGGAGAGGGGGGGGFSGSSFLFFSGSLKAVDPAAPASPITVEAGQIQTNSTGKFYAGTYNSATKTVTNFHTHAVMYAKTDGKLYRVSALKDQFGGHHT